MSEPPVLLDTIVFGIISTFCTDDAIKLILNILAKNRSYYYEDKQNNRTYRNGLLHSINDQPAVIYANGMQCWYKNGLFHRDPDSLTGKDQPAIINANGTQYWYKNGKRHRDPDPLTGKDQPAIIDADGTQYWYKNDQRYHP